MIAAIGGILLGLLIPALCFLHIFQDDIPSARRYPTSEEN